MDKDIKLQLAIAKMEGEVCLAIDIIEIFCPQKKCEKCIYFNKAGR
jgi:hypothetical protein